MLTKLKINWGIYTHKLNVSFNFSVFHLKMYIFNFKLITNCSVLRLALQALQSDIIKVHKAASEISTCNCVNVFLAVSLLNLCYNTSSPGNNSTTSHVNACVKCLTVLICFCQGFYIIFVLLLLYKLCVYTVSQDHGHTLSGFPYILIEKILWCYSQNQLVSSFTVPMASLLKKTNYIR